MKKSTFTSQTDGFRISGTANKLVRNTSVSTPGNGSFYGFHFLSANNSVVLLNTAVGDDGGGFAGFWIDSAVFSLNAAIGGGAAGFNLFGNKFVVIGNRTVHNAGDGITIDTTSTKAIVLTNRADNNGGNGISMLGSSATFKANAALHNGGDDLRDNNSGCAGDLWVGDTFGTTNMPACVH